MKKLAIILSFTCAWVYSHAQVNFVRNPDFEQYSKCPDDWSEIYYANNWRNATDSTMSKNGMEYYNVCGNTGIDKGLYVPDNTSFYQYPHSGNGMAGGHFYNDGKIPPPSPLPNSYRDYLQGHLIQPLIAGKTYCVSFWVNCTEASGYAHNKIGVYLDNGSVNHIADTAGKEITTVTPQVYTDSVLADTANWVKIEGSFVASGNETYITIGNFFPNSMVTTKVTNYWFAFPQYSYYLIDDVSVIPIDSPARAGADRWVEMSKTVNIGRVGDTTAKGLDCKWYHKGVLIDSSAIISVHAAATKGIVDTYVVVQTICGIVTTDTVNVWTVGLGINNIALQNTFSIYPNPSDGNIVISKSEANNKAISVKVFDLLGRVLQQQQLAFANNQSSLKINLPTGTYIVELQDSEGNVNRERISIH
jgi:hypothetical protein